jgi:hypothetical protein
MTSASQSDDYEVEIDRVITELHEYIKHVVGKTARVQRDRIGGTIIHTLDVDPVNPQARDIDVVGEQFLIVQIGEEGGRFELDYTSSDVDLAKRIIDATVAGRVTETFGLGFTTVVVTLDDGSGLTETGIGLPIFPVLWPTVRRRFRGPRVRYAPYDPK